MDLQLITYSPINQRHNASVHIESYADIEKTIKEQIANLTDIEVLNMQFTMVVVANSKIKPFTFGVNRGNAKQTERDILDLASHNKYAKTVSCTRRGSYLVIENYPRSFKRSDHANIPVERQTTMTFGHAKYPIYSVGNFGKPVVNKGDTLATVFADMQHIATR
jgi:hypothetical protein